MLAQHGAVPLGQEQGKKLGGDGVGTAGSDPSDLIFQSIHQAGWAEVCSQGVRISAQESSHFCCSPSLPRPTGGGRSALGGAELLARVSPGNVQNLSSFLADSRQSLEQEVLPGPLAPSEGEAHRILLSSRTTFSQC